MPCFKSILWNERHACAFTKKLRMTVFWSLCCTLIFIPGKPLDKDTYVRNKSQLMFLNKEWTQEFGNTYSSCYMWNLEKNGHFIDRNFLRSVKMTWRCDFCHCTLSLQLRLDFSKSEFSMKNQVDTYMRTKR